MCSILTAQTAYQLDSTITYDLVVGLMKSGMPGPANDQHHRTPPLNLNRKIGTFRRSECMRLLGDLARNLTLKR